MTHQTSQAVGVSGIVPTPLLDAASGQEDIHDAEVVRPVTRPQCARCGRRGRFVRHTTLVHVRPRPTPRR